MTQSLRQIKSRIRSVESIKKLTRAMEMVSASKVRPLQGRLHQLKDYFVKVDSIVHDILSGQAEIAHPLLTQRAHKQKTALCVLSSDSGLCGSYNSNIIQTAEKFIKESPVAVDILTVGKKGYKYFKKGKYSVQDSSMEFHGRFNGAQADSIADQLVQRFLTSQVDEVFVAYSRFESASRHHPTIEKILPVAFAQGQTTTYLSEPDIDSVVENLVPLYIKSKMRMMFLNAFVSEHSARVIAMGEATENATELLDGLILQRNKMRQASITKEIIEVISSADALKG